MTQSKTTRRQIDIDAQIMFLSKANMSSCRSLHERMLSTRKSLLQAPQPYPIIIRRVHKSIDEQRRVIWLRFGSLDTMEKQWHTATQVKEMTGISTSCQWKIIKRWLERGKKVVSFKCLTGAKIKVPEDVRALIASPEWLLKQRHLSLEERAAYWRDSLQLDQNSLHGPLDSSTWSTVQHIESHRSCTAPKLQGRWN
jgi:hypothetical protein